MSGAATGDQVEHVPARHRFFVRLPEGQGELVYRRLHGTDLELLHTGVDAALRGRGVGGALAQAAFDFARAEGLRVLPTCPYVQRWLERHPAEADLVAPANDRERSRP